MAEPLLQLRGLRKSFTRNGRTLAALDGVDLDIPAGATVALAGASGSGKSTLARCVMRLTTPDAGTIHLAGTDLLALNEPALRRLRPRFQMVFQDPSAAFNPRATVLRALSDPLRLHSLAPSSEWRARALDLLEMVRLPPDLIDRRPHELSGGQRQRVAIARALATNPSLVVLDEPVSALDVSVRNAVLNLLQDLQARTGVAYLLISHDLAVVRAIARTVAIMDQGRIVEAGPVAEIFAHPTTDTTRRLLAAVPRLTLPPSPP
jgi:peptide/nickel transport system ATP-binding protein